ncbi:MAG: hypothetical protein ACRBBP_08595 [Bdellovibrionales bacterium]
MKKLSKFILMAFCLSSFILVAPSVSQAKKKKRQTIDLEGADIDGEVRTPTGDYVLQKSGVDFLPLYEKKREMNKEIKKTVHFLR